VEGHDLVIVEVGPTDAVDSTVLHVPDVELVVAGDVIYSGTMTGTPRAEARRVALCWLLTETSAVSE
jgi:hypothetical protein